MVNFINFGTSGLSSQYTDFFLRSDLNTPTEVEFIAILKFLSLFSNTLYCAQVYAIHNAYIYIYICIATCLSYVQLRCATNALDFRARLKSVIALKHVWADF